MARIASRGPVRLAIVHRDKWVGYIAKRGLADSSGVDIVCCLPATAEGIAGLATQTPQVVATGCSSIALVPGIRVAAPKAKLLMLITDFRCDIHLAEALESGADAFFMKYGLIPYGSGGWFEELEEATGLLARAVTLLAEDGSPRLGAIKVTDTGDLRRCLSGAVLLATEERGDLDNFVRWQVGEGLHVLVYLGEAEGTVDALLSCFKYAGRREGCIVRMRSAAFDSLSTYDPSQRDLVFR